MAHVRHTSALALLTLSALLAAACSDPETQKVQHFERGNAYAAEKKYAEAIIEYRNAVRLDPKFGEAYFRLAQAYDESENIQAAFPEYVRAADALPANREAQIKAIELLLIGGRFEDAKARATTWLDGHPDDVDVLLLLANAMAALKDPEGALAEIEEAMKIRPDDSRTYMSLGNVRMRTGDAQEAEAAFRRAIAVDPSSVNAQLALANYLWSAGRPDEAEQAIKEAIVLEPKHALANRMLGTLYLATKRSEEAEAPLKAYADVTEAPAARFALAEYYTGARRFGDAVAVLTELAADPTVAAEAELRLASIDYVQGRRPEAHQRLDAVLKSSPTHPTALELKARWLGTENRMDEALTAARAAVAAAPQSASAHYVLAAVHDRRREVREAMAAYGEVLRLNPRAAAAQVQLSRLSLASGDREAAVRYAEGATQAAPGALEVRAALVRSLLARGDLARATPEVAALVKAAPQNATVHLLDGNLQLARRNTGAARTSFERALAISPNLVEAVAGLTTLDLSAKQPAPALARVETALRDSPDNPALLAVAAQAYAATGDLPKAEQALRHAVEIDPRFNAGYGMLARLYLAQKRIDEARGEFEAMVKRDPTNVGARTMVGILLEAQNKRDEARKWYEDTVAVTERAPIVANNLAFMYAESGSNLDRALDLATTAKQQLPDNPDVDDTLGWVYYKKDQAALAVGPLEASVEKNPKNALYLYHLGLAYAKVGNTVKARDMLQRALQIDGAFAGADEARRTLESLRG